MEVWILILIILVLVILSQYTLNNYQNYKWDLAVLCIVKNEEMVLEEWLEHNIWQGVQHFYIIDNGSTDGTKNIIQRYVSKGLATYYYMDGKAKQAEHYNKVYNEKARSESKWLAVIDVDEFMYNRTKGKTIRDYVSELDYNKFGGARLQFKMFGSSDHVKQPNKIRESFLWRQKFEPTDTCCPWKTIVNTKETEILSVHDHTASKPIKKDYDDVIINHYQIMSKEYFEKIKMTRGDVAGSDNRRDWNYFKERDFKDELDDELVNLLK
jgi:hypothetical protein